MHADNGRNGHRSAGRSVLFAVFALQLSVMSAPARADTLDTILGYLTTAGVVDPTVKDAKPLIQCLVSTGNPNACVNVKSLAEQQGKTAVKQFTPDDPMINAAVEIIRAANKSDWITVLELTGTDVLVQIACKSGLSTGGPLKNFICGDVFKEVSHLAKPVVREVLAAMNPPDLWELIGLVGNIDLACKLVPDFVGKDEACGTLGKALAAIGGAAADAAKFGGKLVVSGADAFENVLFGSDSHMPYDKYYALYWLPWFHKGAALCLGQNCSGLGNWEKRIWDPCVEYFDSHNQYASTARKTCDDMRDKRFDPGVKAMAKAMKGSGEAHAALMRGWARTWAVEDYGKDTLALRKTSFTSNCEFALRKAYPFPQPDPALCEAHKKSPFYKQFKSLFDQMYAKCMSDINQQLPSPSAWVAACTQAQPKFAAVFNEEKALVQQQINHIVAAGCFPPQGWSAAQGLKFECTNYEAYGVCLTGLKAGAEKQHCKVDATKADAERAKQIVAALASKRCHAIGASVACTRPWKVEACKAQLAGYKPLAGVKSAVNCSADLDAFALLQKQAQKILFAANGGTQQNTGMKTEKGDGLVMVLPPSGNNCKPQNDPLALRCSDSTPAIAAAKTAMPGGTIGACAPDPKIDGADAPCLIPVHTVESGSTMIAQPVMPGGAALGQAPQRGASPPLARPLPNERQVTSSVQAQPQDVDLPAVQSPSARNSQPTTPTINTTRGFNLPPPVQPQVSPAGNTAALPAVQSPPVRNAQPAPYTTGAVSGLNVPPPMRPQVSPPAATAVTQPARAAVIPARVQVAEADRTLAPAGCTSSDGGVNFTCATRAGFDRCESLRQLHKVQTCSLTPARLQR